MAKKPKSELALFKDDLKILREFNKRMKLISDVYYIGSDGNILLKSLSDTIEKVCFLQDPLSLSRFAGCMINASRLNGFLANMKISTLEANIYEKVIELRSDSNIGKLSIDIPIVYSTAINDADTTKKQEYLNEEDFIIRCIRPKLYKKFFEISANCEINNLRWYPLDDTQLDEIVDAQMIEFTSPDVPLLEITKALVLDFKKEDDGISIAALPYETNEKVYRLLRNTNSVYSVITMVGQLKDFPDEVNN